MKQVALVCLCYVENATPAQIRYGLRRLRRKAPEAFILVSLVGDAGEISNAEELQASATFDIVRHSLSETVDRILAVADGSRIVDEVRTEAALAKVG
jgi:hypothetical protein